MVLYQQPEPTSIMSPSLCHGFQKQKGVSVPNLGLPQLSTLFRTVFIHAIYSMLDFQISHDLFLFLFFLNLYSFFGIHSFISKFD